jgi:hypothetical protein
MYEIKEATIGQLLPIFPLIETDPKSFQFELVKVCVYKDGQPIGAAAADLPVSEYMKLAIGVMEKNSFGADAEKKD